MNTTLDILKKAFEAGGDYATECFCGECDYCMLDEKKSPNFEEWLLSMKSELTYKDEVWSKSSFEEKVKKYGMFGHNH